MSVLRKILSPESKQHDLRKTHLSQSHRMIIAPGDVEGLLINSCLEIPSEPVSEMQSVMIVNDIDDLNSSIPSTEEDPTLEDSKFQALSISFYNRKENDTCLNRTLMSPSPITALLTPRNMYESNRNTQAETHRERFTQAETHRERYTQAETHRERNTQAENRSNQLSYRATPNMLTGRNTALEKLDKSALYSIAERMVSPVNKSMLNASKIYNRIMQGHKSPTRAEISKEDLKPKPRMAVKGNITNQMIAKLEKQLGKDKSTSSSSSKVSQLTTKPSSRQDIRSTRTKINPDETASFNQGHTISKGKIKLEADLSILSPRTATNQNNTSKLAKNVSKENLLRESASSKFLMYNGKETKKIATRFIELKRNRELEASESSFKKKDASSIINLSQLRKSVERQGGKKPFASPSKKVLQTSILNSISPEKSILKKSSGFQTSREGQSNVQKLALHRLQANISQQQSKKGLVSLRDSSVENGNEHSHDQTRSEQEEFVTTNANLQRTQKSIQTAREDRNPLHSQRGALNFAYGFGSASTKNLPTTSRLKRDESSTDLSLKGNTTERSQKGFSSIKKMIRDESSADLRSGATTERGGNKREVLVSFKKMIRDESSPELLKKPNTERGPLGRFHENDERKAVVKKDNVRLDEYFEEDGVKFYQYNKVSNKSKNNKENKVMFDSEQNRTKGHTYYNGATGLGARDARSNKGAVQAGNYSYWK